jgi:hypothetical protein
MKKPFAVAGTALAGTLTLTGLTATTAQADTSGTAAPRTTISGGSVRGDGLHSASAQDVSCDYGLVCGYDASGDLLWWDGVCDPLHIFNFGADGLSDITWRITNYLPNSAAQAYNYGGSAGWLTVGSPVTYPGVRLYATGSPQGIDGVKVICNN